MKRRLLHILGWGCSLWLGWAAGPAARGADPAGDEGLPFTQHFSPLDYHANTQCSCVVQDARGILYAGNYSLVLEYDGSTWRKIPAGKAGWVNRLAYDAATDTIYVGSQNELGYLRPVPGGGREFVSLLDQLPTDARNIGDVRGVYVTPEGVFFVGSNWVRRWRDGHFLKTWTYPGVGRLHSDRAGGQFYLQHPKLGLLRFEGDEFVSASDDPFFRKTSAWSFVDGANGDVVFGTHQDGLFTLRDGRPQPWEGEINAFLKAKGIYRLLRLRDGSLAIATENAGLILLDAAGRFRTRVDGVGGLHGNDLFDLCEDAEGGLWIGLQSGLTRAEIHSPFTLLSPSVGSEFASVMCSARWFDTTVLGTFNGLFRVVGANAATAMGAHLERLPGIDGAYMSAVGVEEGMIVARESGVLLLDREAKLIPLVANHSNEEHLRRSRLRPDRVFVGEDHGRVTALDRDPATGRWADAGTVAETGKPGTNYGVVESARGDFWLGTNEQGLLRVRPAADGAPVVVTSFMEEPGPLHGEATVWVDTSGGPIVFQTPKSFYRLDEREEGIRLATEYGPWFTDGSYHPETILSYDESSLWVTASHTEVLEGDALYGRIIAGGEGRAAVFQALPQKLEQVLGHLQGFLPLQTPPATLTSLLIAGSGGGGVVRLDIPRWEAQLAAPRPFATLIRRVLTIAGQSAPVLQDALPYARNTLRFEFSANTFDFGASPRFQTRLVGLGAGQWSDWNERPSVDYLNLPEGNYTFEVRARVADGRLGEVAARTFRVLPPWQRNPLAYACYALLALLGIAALVRWRGRQLLRRNAALETLVTARTGELRGREAELVRARDDADAANRAKSAFLANMSHELRTPLNAILGYSQIMAKHADLPHRTREQVQVIHQSGEHLLSLINEVLDLSKIEAGKLTLAPSDFSLDQLVANAAAAFRPRVAEKGLAFRQTLAPGLPGVVRADLNRLRQVLFNLLGNAVKFTRSGTVWLDVRAAEGGRVRFEVGDTGVGIADDQLHSIFLAFHQTGESALASQGTGLGLAISQRLVGLMGGEIRVESTPGRGSRFWFDLPLAAGDAAALAPTVGKDAGAERYPVTGYEGTPRRLLVVDDQPENRRVLRDFLQPLGFEIEEAADSAGCLAACARRWPDAVLLDLRLGDRVDGFEVARALRTRAAGRPLGVIAVSASVFEDARHEAVASGCDDFLPKPFEESRLLGTLSHVLGLRWTRAGGESTPPVANEDAAPPAEEVEALLALSLQGDVVGLRERLDALGLPGASAGSAALVRVLEPLVANYQMDQLHEKLLRFQEHERP